MNKITFLFGAGASCNALPMVKEIPERLKVLINTLSSSHLELEKHTTPEGLNLASPKSKLDYQKGLISDLKWLWTESLRHSSVDTLAKKLTIKRQFEELERLKIALSIFFIFEQAQRLPDKRYDSFFASIINRDATFPENIRIISWNYDYQFELSYSEYSGRNIISDNQQKLNIQQKTGILISPQPGFSIYKLNGTTEIFSHNAYRQYAFTDNIPPEINKNFIEDVVRNYAAITTSGNFKSTISFAWEPEDSPNTNRSFIDSLDYDVKDSIALVVIGYSFPFFNRDVDRKIINAMNQLKRVYFQAPDADVLLERFKAIKDNTTNIDLVKVFDVGQFLLPNEL